MGKNKYGNTKTACLSKHTHDSKMEANYCNRLLAMKQNREIKDYDVQVGFDMVVNSKHICKHIVDFVIIHHDDTCDVRDTKGHQTPEWKLKYKLFQALYPQYQYHVVTKH